ncbi:MAG: hypothetical protein U0168_05795 [Nannocystaceae bacterium]
MSDFASIARRRLGPWLPCILWLGACSSPPPPQDGGSSSSTTGEPPIPCAEDMPCPGEMVCLVGQCADAAPAVEIVSPEFEQKVDWSQGAGTSTVTVTVRAPGLTLVDPTMDPNSTRGQGQIAVLLDGVEVASVASGDAEAGVPVDIAVPSVAGGHRLRAVARLSDGRDYDNPEAIARSMFWFDDGVPRVTFVSPVPGDQFTTSGQKLDVTVAVLNFTLVPAASTAEPGPVGIVHVLEDVEFPACAEDPMCLSQYIGVVNPAQGMVTSATVTVNISNAQPGKGHLTAHLATTNHELYCPDDPCVPVFETIAIGRFDPDATTGGDSSGGGEAGGGTTTGGGTTG